MMRTSTRNAPTKRARRSSLKHELSPLPEPVAMHPHFSIPLVLKLAKPNVAGEFSGIAATWSIDRDGERFARGAFAQSLADWRRRGSMPPVLLGHDPRQPAGVIVDARETDIGLEVIGRLALGTDDGRRAHELLLSGPGALAMSVGFSGEVDRSGPVPIFLRVELMEVSRVAIPAQAGAVVTAVKSPAAERFTSRKDFEHAARNALGISANEAKRLAAGGWAALTRNESDAAEHEPTNATIKAALSRIANARYL